jgi:hypothetical protein
MPKNRFERRLIVDMTVRDFDNPVALNLSEPRC